MELGGGGPDFPNWEGPTFNDEDPKEAAAGATVFGITGGALAAAAGAASLPGIIAGAAVGAGVYGTCVLIKWSYKKLRRLF